jgi:hypothetical protein
MIKTTHLNFVNLLKVKSAPKVTRALELTTELRGFITGKSTRQNSAYLTPALYPIVSTANFVLLPIPSRTLKFVCSTYWTGATSTFTPFSLKLSGVLSIRNTTKLSAFMHTTFRTSDGGQIFSTMRSPSVLVGRVVPS